MIARTIINSNSFVLDALISVMDAPARSEFNRVERRMAPHSAQLSGVILNYETFSSHLNNQGKTVDVELEKKTIFCSRESLSRNEG